jgi:hypothetical protein
MVDARYSPEMNNVDVELGHLTKRKGYASYGTTTARQVVTSITRAVNTATVTTTLAHGYTTGDSITISGAGESDYNGTYTITVTSAVAFTYAVANTPATPATGTIYSTTGLTGVVLGLIEFPAASGTTFFVLITTTREYKFNGTNWDDITFRTAAPVYTNKTGTEDNGLDWVIVSGEDSAAAAKKWLIITNGVDKPRYWDGVQTHFFEYSTASVANKGAALTYTSFVTCKTLNVISGYLVLGNVTTSANEPDVVAWADTFSLTDFLNGNSGAIQFTDIEGAIIKLLPLGDRLMVYSENSVHFMLHIGGIVIFTTQKILSSTRLLSGRAIVDVGPYHYFMSQENIYLFDGTKGIRRMGDRVTLRYRQQLASSLKTRAWAFLDQPKNTIYFAVPRSTDVTTIYKLEFDIFDVVNNKWSIHEYADRPTAMGFFANTASLTWNSSQIATTLWSEMAGTWNQGSILAGFPRRFLGHSASVSLADDTLFSDAGDAIDAEWQSPDYTIPRDFLSEHARWTEIEFEARGTALDVSISIDKGSSFELASTEVLSASWTTYRVFIDTVSKTLRIRFSNSTAGQGFEVRWHRAWFTRAGGD